MTSSNKMIATYSWLLRRADRLFREDPDAFTRLAMAGTHSLIPGCFVRMTRHNMCNSASFHILNSDKNDEEYCVIRGRHIDGEFYTTYDTNFSTTKWRKRLDRFMPYVMLDKPSYDNGCPVQFLNSDGSFAVGGRWRSGRRKGRPGQFIHADHTQARLILKDSDGRFCDLSKMADARRFYTDFAEQTDAAAGFFPGSSPSKSSWYESMIAPADKPSLWDSDAVRLLAARTHAEALRLVQKFPHMKIVLFPMTRIDGLNNEVIPATDMTRFGLSGRRRVVLDRSAGGVPEAWYMPELVVYWIEESKQHRNCYHLLFVRVIVPAIGNPLLEPDEEKSSPISNTNLWGSGTPKRYHAFGLPVERSYHGLACLKPEASGKINMRYCHSSSLVVEQAGSPFVDWRFTKDQVIVIDCSTEDLLSTNYDYQRVAHKPDAAFTSIEERELIDSLPLC